ncbi:MAG: hypothetical protein Q9187_005926, partial [Circinaria calcarea]
MRQHFLKHPNAQDICIFCTLRIQRTTSPYHLRTSQRRPFQSSPSTYRPATAAAAQHEEGQESFNHSNNSWTDIPAINSRGGWARHEVAVQLTPDEEREREGLCRNLRIAQTAPRPPPSKVRLARDSALRPAATPQEVQAQSRDANVTKARGNRWGETTCTSCGTTRNRLGSKCRTCGNFCFAGVSPRQDIRWRQARGKSGVSEVGSPAEKEVVLKSEGGGSSQKDMENSFDTLHNVSIPARDSTAGAPMFNLTGSSLHCVETSNQNVSTSRQSFGRKPGPQPFTAHAVDTNASGNRGALLPWSSQDDSDSIAVLLPRTDANEIPRLGHQPMEDAASTLGVEASQDNARPSSRYVSESTPTSQTRPRDDILDEHISSMRSSPIHVKTAGKRPRPLERYEWDCAKCGQRNDDKTSTCRRCSNRRSLTMRLLPTFDNPQLVRPVEIDTPSAFDDKPSQHWKHLRKRQGSGNQDPDIREPVPKGQGAQVKTRDPGLEEIENQRLERLRAASKGRFVGFRGTSKHISKNLASNEVKIPETTVPNDNSRTYHRAEGSKDPKAYNPIETLVPALAQDGRQVKSTTPIDSVQPTPSPTAWTRSKPPMDEAPSSSRDTSTAPIESTEGEAVKKNDLALDKGPNYNKSGAEKKSPEGAGTRGLSGAWAVWSSPVAKIEESTPSQLETPGLGPAMKENQPEDGQNHVESLKKAWTPEQPVLPLFTLWKPPISEFQVTHPSEAEKGASTLPIRHISRLSKTAEDRIFVPAFEGRRPVRKETSGSFASMPKSAVQLQGIQDDTSNDQDLIRDSKGYIKWRPSVSEPETVAAPQGSSVEDDQIIKAKDPIID